MNSPDERRDELLRIRSVADHYERRGLAGKEVVADMRYDLSVRAGDLNGDGCRFPACGCARADCAQRPVTTPIPEWTR